MNALEKKVKFTDKPGAAKIIYSVVIALLCITAVVVGLVAANNRKDNTPVTPPTGENPDSGNTGDKPDDGGNSGGNTGENPDSGAETPKPAEMTFIAPVAGKIVKEHSMSIPVFSETLEEWRVHTGIDISAEEGADVFCVYDGEVTDVFSHPLHGFTVVVKHSDTIKSIYSNLDAKSENTPKVGDKLKSGDKIGNVGDTSLSELAEEPHLHFEVKLDDKFVNPVDYFSEEAKKSSLGQIPETKPDGEAA